MIVFVVCDGCCCFIVCVFCVGLILWYVVVIMDGNCWFVCVSGVVLVCGYVCGVDVFREVCAWCFEFGVETLSVYALSTENFKCLECEFEVLFDLVCGEIGMLIDDEGL